MKPLMFLLLLAGVELLCAENLPLYLWAKNPEKISGVTHVFNQVWVSKSEKKYSEKKYYELKSWLEKEITALPWEGGEVYRSFSDERLYETWSSTLRLGHLGFHIDEISQTYPAFIAKADRVLARIKTEYPDALIWFWQAGPVTPEIAGLYHKYADAVFLEIYFASEASGFVRITDYSISVKEFGLQDLAIPCLDADKKKWIKSTDLFVAQLSALKQAGLLRNGLALFAPAAPDDLLLEIVSYYQNHD